MKKQKNYIQLKIGERNFGEQKEQLSETARFSSKKRFLVSGLPLLLRIYQERAITSHHPKKVKLNVIVFYSDC